MKNLNINKELTKKIKSFYKRLEEENLDATIEPEIVCEKEVYRIKYNVHLKDFFTIVVDDLNDEAIETLNEFNTAHELNVRNITIGKDWSDYWNEGVSAEEYWKIKEPWNKGHL